MALDNTKEDNTAHNYCEHCGINFQKRRRDMCFCGSKFRKAKSQKRDRRKNRKNSQQSPEKRRENAEFFDAAYRLAEELYKLPPTKRRGYMKVLVDGARNGNTKLKGILTNHVLLRAGKNDRQYFFRGCFHSYSTISQAANKYCHRFWGKSVETLVRDNASELEDGVVC